MTRPTVTPRLSRTLRALIALSLCAFAGAAAAESPPVPADAPKVDGADKPAAPPAQEFLAWGISDEGPTTAWVRAHADGRAEVLATTPRVLVAGGGGVWRFVESRSPAKVLDCECFYDKPDADPEKGECMTEGEVNQQKLTDVLSGKVAVTYGITGADTKDIASSETWAGVIGSAEGALFVVAATDVFACGAHGSVVSEFAVIDLAVGKALTDKAWLEAAQGAATAQRAKAAEGFKANAAETMIDEVGPDEAGGKLTAVYPVYLDAAAAPQWRYQFTRDACYACSDGRWDSYSVSEWVEAPAAPKGAPAALPAPPAVQKAWAEMKANDASRGFSPLKLDDAAAAKLLAAMKAP